jgi:hypothetical protein
MCCFTVATPSWWMSWLEACTCAIRAAGALARRGRLCPAVVTDCAAAREMRCSQVLQLRTLAAIRLNVHRHHPYLSSPISPDRNCGWPPSELPLCLIWPRRPGF